MARIAIDHDFPSNLAKRLRRRLQDSGVDLKQTDVLADIAAALGWRPDALQHYLKTRNPGTSALSDGDEAPERTARRLGMIDYDPALVLSVQKLRAAGWHLAEDGTPDGPICWSRTLARHPDGEVSDELWIEYQEPDTIGTSLIGDPDEPRWRVKRHAWDSDGETSAVGLVSLTLDQAMTSGPRLPIPRDEHGEIVELGEFEGPIPSNTELRFRTDIATADGAVVPGIVLGEPVVRDDGYVDGERTSFVDCDAVSGRAPIRLVPQEE